VAQKNVDHHAVCELNLRKLLINHGFIHEECRSMPEIGSEDDKEFTSVALLFMFNDLCDIIHDVTDKHVYV